MAEQAAAGIPSYDGVDGCVAAESAGRLTRELLRLSLRTLVLELRRASRAGQLAGATPAERFTSYTRLLAGGSGLAGLLPRYPVLDALLRLTCERAAAAQRELLDRLAADRDLLVATLFGGRDPGPLVSADAAGDRHGGRAVTILTFESGRRVVYRPRPVELHAHFHEIVEWLNDRTGLDLATIGLLRRDGYGWLEFAEHAPCRDRAGVRRFYLRQGALLALLYVLDGTDIHYQNLVAAGDQPVLVDVETLFHPVIDVPALTGPDPAADALGASVYRTALLPLLLLGEDAAADISGLGGDHDIELPSTVVDWQDAGLDTMRLVRRPARARAAQNRPMLDGVVAEPGEHRGSLLAGFRAAYDAIAAHRDELLAPDGPLARCAGAQVRVVARATAWYATLLDEATHPDALADPVRRDELFSTLGAGPADDTRARLLPHELTDLRAGDVPMFTTRPDSADLWTVDGTRLPGLLTRSGLDTVRAKVAALGEIDRHRQEWVIAASLAMRRPARTAPVRPAPRPAAAGGTGAIVVPPDPGRVLAAASGIADEIVAHSLTRADRANWMGLELVGDLHWAVQPLGAGLSNGYTGVALFLAQLSALTGAGRYSELAADAVRPLPALLAAFAAAPELAAAAGTGFHGLGGLCYATARLGALLDAAALDWLDAGLAAIAAAAHATPAGPPGFVDGDAGGLAAMLAVEAETGRADARLLADGFADRLAQLVESGCPAPAGGFARGCHGTGWALLSYAAARGSARHHRAGMAALHCGDLAHDPAFGGPREHSLGEHDLDDSGWCCGAAGRALAAGAGRAEDPAEAYGPHAGHGTRVTDLSLCHGRLGAVEPVIQLADRGEPAAQRLRARLTGLVLGTLAEHGPRCGTPDGVRSPGLLTGLAGIGYGLLRLGFGDRVPSVLLLQPGPH
jgi:type 2 lantibiotic biosynthesis protein LanM